MVAINYYEGGHLGPNHKSIQAAEYLKCIHCSFVKRAREYSKVDMHRKLRPMEGKQESFCKTKFEAAVYGNLYIYSNFWQLLVTFGSFLQLLVNVGNFLQLVATCGSFWVTIQMFFHFCTLFIFFLEHNSYNLRSTSNLAIVAIGFCPLMKHWILILSTALGTFHRDPLNLASVHSLPPSYWSEPLGGQMLIRPTSQ